MEKTIKKLLKKEGYKKIQVGVIHDEDDIGITDVISSSRSWKTWFECSVEHTTIELDHNGIGKLHPPRWCFAFEFSQPVQLSFQKKEKEKIVSTGTHYCPEKIIEEFELIMIAYGNGEISNNDLEEKRNTLDVDFCLSTISYDDLKGTFYMKSDPFDVKGCPNTFVNVRTFHRNAVIRNDSNDNLILSRYDF